MANPNPETKQLVPFVKGDPRINRKGIPSTAIEVRRLIQAIGAQKLPLPQSEKEKAERKRKKYITRLEALLTAMFSSRAPADKQTILKGGYPGLLKDEVDVTSGGEKINPYMSATTDELREMAKRILDAGDAENG